MVRDLIKKFLKETVEEKDLLSKIYNWSGNDRLMKDIWKKVDDGLQLTDDELEYANNFVDDSNFERIELLNVSTNTSLQSLIKKNGIDTYLKLIKRNPSFRALLDEVLKDSVYSVGSPSDSWYKRNLDDLTYLQINFKSNAGEIKWADKTKMTFEDKIEEMKEKCINRDFYGILESEGDDNVWSLLNKVDTNYVNWSELIRDRQKNREIKSGSDASVIQDYFKPRNLSQIRTHGLGEIINSLKKTKGISIDLISYADLDVLEAFLENGEKLSKIITKIQGTTDEGDQIEKNFKDLVRNGYNNEIVRDFSTWGNIVDTTFGIDLVLSHNGTLYATQVKKEESHAVKAFVRKLGIPYLCIYPSSKAQRNRFNFKYISQRNHGNFNQDFKVNQDLSDKGKEFKKEDDVFDYMSWVKKWMKDPSTPMPSKEQYMSWRNAQKD